MKKPNTILAICLLCLSCAILSTVYSNFNFKKISDDQAKKTVKMVDLAISEAYGQGQYDALTGDIRIKITGSNEYHLTTPPWIGNVQKNRKSILQRVIEKTD